MECGHQSQRDEADGQQQATAIKWSRWQRLAIKWSRWQRLARLPLDRNSPRVLQLYDGVDNDHDGKTDCEDSDCLADPRIKQHCEMMHGGSSNKGKGCKDDAHGTLANIGSSCAAAIQAIHGNCNADVSVGGLFPKGTLAHHVCPKTCNTCSGGGGH